MKKINKIKEESKINIQKIFTKLRKALNEREDELLLEIDNKYNELNLNDGIIKKNEKLFNKIKISLEKGTKLENNWNNEDHLILRINTCLNIENIINEINSLNEILEKINNLNIDIEFYRKENGINKLINTLRQFGKIGKSNKFDTKIEFYDELIDSWLNYK